MGNTLLKAVVLLLFVVCAAANAGEPAQGVVRPAGARWPFKDGDRLYWFGASHTAIGIYCSTVEFYVRTRFPEMKIVSAHTSKPTGLSAGTVAKVIDERKPTIVFPEGGFYDTPDPVKFTANARDVAGMCSNKNVRCIFLPTMWLGNTLKKAPAAFQAKDVTIEEAMVQAAAADPKFNKWQMTTPAEIHGPYFRNHKGLALDKTMAALKEWGDKNGYLVLETYNDQAEWAKAQWAKNPDFIFLEGSTPHPVKTGYMVVGIYALERLDAPILESALELEVAAGDVKVKKSVNCEASELTDDGKSLSFKRVDKVLPVIPPVAAWDIPADPAPVLKQSPYMLKISGLTGGNYEVAIAGTVMGKATAEELAAGVNVNELSIKKGGNAPKLPWSGLWNACRGSTMDKDFAPGENEQIGKSAWAWTIKRL